MRRPPTWLTVLRSGLFYLGYSLFTVLFCGTALLFVPLLPPLTRFYYLRNWNRVILCWLRICCGIKTQVEGLENIPPAPFVVLSKHQSPWDTIYLQLPFGPLSTVLKRELLSIPFFGWALALIRPIPIDRDKPREALRQVMEEGKERLAAGVSILVFPEGTRIEPGQQGKYAKSGASIACSMGVPVLPVALNAGLCWPAHGFLKYPGTIRVVIGPALPSSDVSSAQLTEQAREWIESTVERISRVEGV